MAGDLSPSQPQPQPQFQQDSSDADISSLLHTILHNSSSPAPAPAPAPAPPCQFSGSGPFSESPAFVDPTFPFSHSSLSFHHPDFHSEEDAPLNSSPPQTARGSSKRCRAAEVHNLSEKRRRQRINEKMKALQKLIPNSNKTDKASMLDEAIEYLKQLQLQVQMLTMRNYSSSSHPFYLPGALQSSSAALLNEGNSCRIGSFTTDQEAPVEAMFNLSGRPSDFMSRMSEDNSSGQALVPEPSMTRQYRSFNASIPSKVPCKDLTLPQLQLDMSHCGQSSSSGVSS